MNEIVEMHPLCPSRNSVLNSGCLSGYTAVVPLVTNCEIKIERQMLSPLTLLDFFSEYFSLHDIIPFVCPDFLSY